MSCVTLHAQQKVNVVLKNGKIVYGTLVNSVFEDFITLEYSALDRENIPLNKISSIHFGKYQAKEVEEANKAFFRRERGFFHDINFQLLFGQDSEGYGYTNVSFHTVNGFAFGPRLMLGGGVGLDKYGDFMVTPLYASIRGLIIERKVSPYYYFNGGWGFMWKPKDQVDWIDYQEADGGYHLQGGLGYQINMKASALTLSAGYRLQKTHMTYIMNGWDWGGATETVIDEDRLLRRFVLSFGYTF
ncbi:hypothetical protein [Catalinimonas alkaloidigena]|uniref:hypothetical protein n=1 Tax=Catalinimonas alkaloidigena TaxID=1075417 RepID=UPI00240633BE|nr:hypothetical protein [Catalinimonas alkaloidigena]